MKFLWGLALGAAVVAYVVVAAGGRPAWLFGAGVVAGALVSISIRGCATARGAGALCPGAPAEPKPAGSGEGGSARRIRRGRLVGVQSRRSMLTSRQQEILSALMNLVASFREAEAAVLAATPGNEGKGFDELFRLALALVNGRRGAIRKGAA